MNMILPDKHLPVQISIRNTRKRREILIKLSIKTPLYIALVSLLLTFHISF